MKKILQALHALISKEISFECDHIPHTFTNVPLKKIMNWLLTEGSTRIRPGRPWGYPTLMFVEPTNFCNLKCTLCPVTEGLNRERKRLDYNTFTKVIDELADYLLLILLWDWGEPFMNPDVYKMIRYGKKKGIQLISSTNGLLFANMEHAENVVDSGLDTLVFAVDGITQETYQKYREGGDLGKVIQGIKNVVQARKRLNSKTPFLNLRFIIMKHNEHELQDVKQFAESLGVDMLTSRTLLPYDDNTRSKTAQVGATFLPDNTDYQRFKLDPVTGERIRRKTNPCKTFWNNPCLHSNGLLVPCSFDPHDSHVMGDLASQSFKEIWYGKKFQEMRNKFRKDYTQLDLCANCTYAFEGGSCSTEDIVHSYFFDKQS